MSDDVLSDARIAEYESLAKTDVQAGAVLTASYFNNGDVRALLASHKALANELKGKDAKLAERNELLAEAWKQLQDVSLKARIEVALSEHGRLSGIAQADD